MAFTTDDFNKIWASTSPLTPYDFDEANYKQGWNFVGSTPPARQMWDYLQKLTDEKIQYIYNNMIPVGIVQAFAGSTTPQGWLLCNGSAVSRTDYADLFAVIGTTYGAGDGSTTFNLPNLIDKFVEGSATSGTVKSAGLPNITNNNVRSDNVCGVKFDKTVATDTWAGAIGTAGSYQSTIVSEASSSRGFSQLLFDASKSNSIYGNSDTVQPPAVTMRYIIKY